MKAYKELYHLLFDGLHRFSFSIVRSKEVAEEIVSDVFIKIWQIRDRLPEIDNLKVYLYTITKNFSLNYIHRNYKNSSLSIEDMDVEPVIEVGNPEDQFISAEIMNKIRTAIQQLPPQCRIVFQLVKEDGMKYKEVAEVMNISVFTVRNQLAIAVRKLAEALPSYARGNTHLVNKFSAS
ncbi:MAG: RNA polymerase sigma-70 factor [Chitinophagaceae bacterium]|nr:RNA polymerase sigma-70 factor [Chitinophagaceae bacterium]